MKETKRKAGQPKKVDAKKHKMFRLRPEVISIIDNQKNKSAFIEKLVLASQK